MSTKLPQGQVTRFGYPGETKPRFWCDGQTWIGGARPELAHLENDFVDFAPPIWDRHEDDPLKGLGALATGFKTYQELHDATKNPIQWVWHGIVANDHLVDIGGFVAGGKTTFATLLICALANPLKEPINLFSRNIIPAPRNRKVVVIEEENGVHSMRFKLERACDLLHLPVRETIDRMLLLVRKEVSFSIETQKKNEKQAQLWQDLETYIKRQAVYATFIDSRALVLTGGDANDEQDQVQVAKKLRRLVNVGKAPIFVLSHLRKPNMNNKVNLEDIAGSGQRVAAGDTVLMVEAIRGFSGEVQATRLVFSKLRDDFEDHPNAIQYKVKDDDGNYNLSWEVDGGIMSSVPDATETETSDDEEASADFHRVWLQEFIAKTGPVLAESIPAIIRKEFRKPKKDAPSISDKKAKRILDDMKADGQVKFKLNKKTKKWTVIVGDMIATTKKDAEKDTPEEFPTEVRIDWGAYPKNIMSMELELHDPDEYYADWQKENDRLLARMQREDFEFEQEQMAPTDKEDGKRKKS